MFVVVVLRLQTRSTRKHPLNNPTSGIGIGSAPQITDASSIDWPSLLDALSTVRVDPDRHDRDGGAENSVAETLGLYSPILDGRFQPNLIYGTRHGRQVFIRIGVDETYRSGITNRHLRQITVLRVGVPVFALVADYGALSVEAGASEALLAVEQSLHPSPDVWDGLRVVGGPEGIVASRPVPRRVRSSSSGSTISGWSSGSPIRYMRPLCTQLASIGRTSCRTGSDVPDDACRPGAVVEGSLTQSAGRPFRIDTPTGGLRALAVVQQRDLLQGTLSARTTHQS